jgi:hypothetical protein
MADALEVHIPEAEPPHGLLGLMAQSKWWRPRVGPPVRVHEMTDTHRLHTARFVVNRASVGLRRDPRIFVGVPLVRALLAGLPRPGEPGWDDLLDRAGHWSTCPRNRDLSAPECSPECALHLDVAPELQPWVPPCYNGTVPGHGSPGTVSERTQR